MKMNLIKRTTYPCLVSIFFIFVNLSKSQPLNSTSDLWHQNTTNLNNTSPECKHCYTELKPHILTFTWTINRYDLVVKTEEPLISPEYSADTNDAIKWRLDITPRGEHLNLGVRPFFGTSCTRKQVLVEVTIKFLNSQQKTLLEHVREAKPYDAGGRVLNDISVAKVLHSSNTLTIFANITFYELIQKQVHQPTQLSILKHHSRENLTASVLFNNWEWPDLILTINGTEYPAHKAVLAARSPYFAAKFKRYSEKGKEIKQINIEDSNHQVFGEILRYMYTGKCENLSTLAQGILTSASKYGMDSLKLICGETLSKNLTVENAANTLILAHKHDVDELKSKTIAFIAKKYTEVAKTASWKCIIKTNPEFVHDVLCQVLSTDD